MLRTAVRRYKEFLKDILEPEIVAEMILWLFGETV